MPARNQSSSPPFPGDDQLATKADVMMLYGVLRQVQEMLRHLSQPVTIYTAEQVCEALRISRSGLEKIDARRIFSDARPRDRQIRGRPRLYFADEVTAYQTGGGSKAVRQLRRDAGRL